MKYFIIAGEQSGDLHGSNLIKGIFASDPGAELFCWGGELMEKAGGKLLMDYRKHAIMGFVPVLMNIRTISRNIKLCKKQIRESNPDVLILVDYPGFNLRMAEYASSLKIKVFYYISPKFWAWKEGRIKKVKLYVDRMFIIFPFEVEYYRRHGISVEYFGNPLVDEVERRRSELGDRTEIRRSLGLDEKPVIALLAGSRKDEVKHILPEMLKVVDLFPEYQFVLASVKSIPAEYYSGIIGNKPVKVIKGKTYEVFAIAEAGLIKSGTSTLEAALLGVPQVVCYKGDKISFLIARIIVKIRVFSLVNLIMGREVVRELIQFLLTTANLKEELAAILPGGSKRERMLADYERLRELLGPAGASHRIAAEIVKSLRTKN